MSKTFLLLLGALVTSGCGDGVSRDQHLSVGQLLEKEEFSGKHIVLSGGCLLWSRHGLTVSSCDGQSVVGPLTFSDDIPEQKKNELYAMTMTEFVHHKRPLSVVLCGTYFRGSGKSEGWFSADGFLAPSEASSLEVDCP